MATVGIEPEDDWAAFHPPGPVEISLHATPLVETVTWLCERVQEQHAAVRFVQLLLSAMQEDSRRQFDELRQQQGAAAEKLGLPPPSFETRELVLPLAAAAAADAPTAEAASRGGAAAEKLGMPPPSFETRELVLPPAAAAAADTPTAEAASRGVVLPEQSPDAARQSQREPDVSVQEEIRSFATGFKKELDQQIANLQGRLDDLAAAVAQQMLQGLAMQTRLRAPAADDTEATAGVAAGVQVVAADGATAEAPPAAARRGELADNPLASVEGRVERMAARDGKREAAVGNSWQRGLADASTLAQSFKSPRPAAAAAAAAAAPALQAPEAPVRFQQASAGYQQAPAAGPVAGYAAGA
eukprot:CAMPEP_0203952648 /NCGR_PEP_ID=MMETSP0359-20131031/86234_1 /ASSEMBLY_ACC=CAM_ASM_000338 /TAXON_ID=268821 /ORGANISM="Scrippsiella Hangoei, Strain SHTV-5" /LENGTH=356 /DNA_ID=CAMNT_0050885701 /DNA_START=56 /DNA_END=1122 /DNA_ORIENTATION=+